MSGLFYGTFLHTYFYWIFEDMMIKEKTPADNLEQKVNLQCKLIQILKNQISAFLSVMLLKQKKDDEK